MSTESQAPRSIPGGTILLQALACILYVTMLANVRFSAGGGDAVIGEAIAELTFIFFLWVTLALLLIVSAVMGQMPRWVAVLSFLLIPFSGLATVTAIDMCSRHFVWPILFPVLLPLLIVFYAAWARFPKLHAAFPANDISIVVWGLIFVLSSAALIVALVL
jgi:hypothetical protein